MEPLQPRGAGPRAGVSAPTAGDYETRDTLASLTMGLLSLLAPFVAPRLLRPVTRGQGRFAKTLVGAATGKGAAVVTTVADVLARRVERRDEPPPAGDDPAATRRPAPSTARQVASVGGVAAIAAGGIAITTAWATATTPERLWERRLIGSFGSGPAALAAAVVGWDFLYYWNHRFMHTSRYMWAVHEVHHSSERYNLSTALRQPVADVLGTSVPYGLLCLVGIPPSAVATARGLNLIYQFWIHTEAIDRIGRAEATLNSPSHHRVHHGSQRQYLDRNHGGILIVWDKLFGTFEPEAAPGSCTGSPRTSTPSTRRGSPVTSTWTSPGTSPRRRAGSSACPACYGARGGRGATCTRSPPDRPRPGSVTTDGDRTGPARHRPVLQHSVTPPTGGGP